MMSSYWCVPLSINSSSWNLGISILNSSITYTTNEISQSICRNGHLLFAGNQTLSISILETITSKSGVIATLNYNLLCAFGKISTIILIFFPIEDTIFGAIQ